MIILLLILQFTILLCYAAGGSGLIMENATAELSSGTWTGIMGTKRPSVPNMDSGETVSSTTFTNNLTNSSS